MLEDFPTSPATPLELEAPTLPTIAESVSDPWNGQLFGNGWPSLVSRCRGILRRPRSPSRADVPAPSVAESFSTIPFSWNTIFDGAWKFAIGTSSPSSPGAFSKPDAISQDARELESVPNRISDRTRSLCPIHSHQLQSRSYHSSIPSHCHRLILRSCVKRDESIVETDLDQRIRSAQSGTVLLFGRTLAVRESYRLLRAISPSSFKMDLPVPPLSEPVEPARESEPVSFPSFMDLQPVAPAPGSLRSGAVTFQR